MEPERERLDGAFAGPETKRRYVRRLFATIADRYDLITVLLSFGRDRAWKVRVVELCGAGAGRRLLDLACGTGDIALAAAARGASAVGLDITLRMLELARRKPLGGTMPFLVGDMVSLPVADAAFQIVTTGYGLRNVPDLRRALSEVHRALAPGGTFCSLDFDRPDAPAIRFVYLTYLTIVGSVLGWILHGDPDTYRYIPESIKRYPGARGVAALLLEIGFVDVRALPVFGGFMAIHVARKREQ